MFYLDRNITFKFLSQWWSFYEVSRMCDCLLKWSYTKKKGTLLSTFLLSKQPTTEFLKFMLSFAILHNNYKTTTKTWRFTLFCDTFNVIGLGYIDMYVNQQSLEILILLMLYFFIRTLRYLILHQYTLK